MLKVLRASFFILLFPIAAQANPRLMPRQEQLLQCQTLLTSVVGGSDIAKAVSVLRGFRVQTLGVPLAENGHVLGRLEASEANPSKSLVAEQIRGIEKHYADFGLANKPQDSEDHSVADKKEAPIRMAAMVRSGNAAIVSFSRSVRALEQQIYNIHRSYPQHNLNMFRRMTLPVVCFPAGSALASVAFYCDSMPAFVTLALFALYQGGPISILKNWIVSGKDDYRNLMSQFPETLEAMKQDKSAWHYQTVSYRLHQMLIDQLWADPQMRSPSTRELVWNQEYESSLGFLMRHQRVTVAKNTLGEEKAQKHLEGEHYGWIFVDRLLYWNSTSNLPEAIIVLRTSKDYPKMPVKEKENSPSWLGTPILSPIK